MKINTVAVIGSGQMGAGIAQVAAQAGFSTLLYDAQTQALEKGVAGIHGRLEKLVEKGKLDAGEKQAVQSRLCAAKSLGELKNADLVIEAIVENVGAKLSLVQELDSIVGQDCILASNTSSISITQIAAASKNPARVIGMHFMNPVPVMALVEVIRGIQTSDATYETICAVSKQMGKTTVLGIDAPGFVVNRILCPMINEAIFLLQQGVQAKDIDTAMKLGTNQPMGPLELADFVGLDTLLSILQLLHRELGEDKYRPCPLLINYVQAGWYGKKSGRGFYSYH